MIFYIFWWLHIEMNDIFWSLKLVWWGRKSSRRLRILGCLGLGWSILTCIKHIKQHTPPRKRMGGTWPENTWKYTIPIRKGGNIFQIFMFGFNMFVFWGCFQEAWSRLRHWWDSGFFWMICPEMMTRKMEGWVDLWCHSTWTIEIMYSILPTFRSFI